MSVLVDSDILCKLAIADLLEPALQTLGYEVERCARLPALPYMLRRGRLRESYGPCSCAKTGSNCRLYACHDSARWPMAR